jgi:hypothetical protein
MPEPFRTHFVTSARSGYEALETAVVNSIWFKNKVTETGVLVRDKNLSNEQELSRSEFTSELMRAYRNGHHGYFTTLDKHGRRPSRYLFMVDGNLPAEMLALAPLWWLSFLASPDFAGWKTLLVNQYEI